MNEVYQQVKSFFKMFLVMNNQLHYPSYTFGTWKTSDGNRYDTYKSAVEHSIANRLDKKITWRWDETKQTDVYKRQIWEKSK